MEVLLSRNVSKVSNIYSRIPRNCIYGYNSVGKRHSRQSVAKHKSLAKLRREYIFQKKETKTGLTTLFETPIGITDPIDGTLKTSLTVDILGKETFPQLTEWRKTKLIQRTRRLLPLPVSLTGLGDGEMPRFWTHLMKKFSFRFNRGQRMKELTLFEKIPVSLRIFFDNFGEKVEKEWPEMYRSYIKSKELYLNNLENNEKQLVYKRERILKFPFELVSQMKQKQHIIESTEDQGLDGNRPKLESGLIDTEYDDYLKHHHLMQFLANSMTGIKNDEYEAEIEGWRDQFWLRNYGTPDPSIEPSNIECSGCGAYLHCSASNIPGYMPSEKFKQLNEQQLRAEKCQRCEYLKHFNVALNVNVKTEQYPELIAKIQNTKALIIIMIDLMDFPCSVWPGIINLIGAEHKVYIVGNKVDLLPKDNDQYLERALYSLKKSLQSIGIDRSARVIDVSLISAKSGFGVENLVTRLLRDRKQGEDLYLIGCTNVGKSTLFNCLLQSDLCKLRDVDLVNRATTSLWPGTTLNLIKFPVREPTGYELQLRLNRLRLYERHDIHERRLKWSLYKQTGDKRYASLTERIGMTYRSELPFTVQSGHPFARRTQTAQPFDPNNKYFRDSNFFYDTPGTIYKDQILTLLTTEELLRTIPREIITPRTFTLRPLQSLFIGGLARIDLSHARQQVWFTVFASHYLPIHVVHTEEAKRFYETYLGTDLLGVPFGGFERIQLWPQMMPKEIVLDGLNWEESCADIVLSTAGWVSITLGADTKCVLKAFTPEGRGIFVRKPPLLPYAFKLRGKRLVGTPCFENKLFTIDDLTRGSIPKRFDRNESIRHISQRRFDRIKQ